MKSPNHNLLQTFIAVLRARVLVTLLLFYSLGYYLGGDMNRPIIFGIIGFMVVALWYINGVCLNDLADKDIDKINLKNATSRPLQSGVGTEGYVWAIAIFTGVLATGCAYIVAPIAVFVILIGILLNYFYSMRPVRISYRGVWAPILLPIGYVLVPLSIACLTANIDLRLESWQYAIVASLYVGFSGRIILKDFRDVVGDAKFGKRTFILRYGRRATCIYSAVTALVSLAILITTQKIIIIIFVLPFYLILLYALNLLKHKMPRSEEHITIAAIARASTGVVSIILVNLVFMDENKAWYIVIIGNLMVLILFGQQIRNTLAVRKTELVKRYY